jgi:hypothetical protein
MAKRVFSTLDMAVEVLRSNPNIRYKGIDLARAIVSSYSEAVEQKRASSSRQMDGRDLELQIAAEIGSGWRAILRRAENIQITLDRPRVFYWSDEAEVASTAQEDLSIEAAEEKSEAELYPILRDYLQQDKDVFSLRIDEKRSALRGGKGASHWLHPDLVGVQLLSNDWGENSKRLSKYYIAELIQLWSFEVKVNLSISNVRASFFQAVSNSSWANFGYLVAASADQRALDELEILTSDHGIGLIILDVFDPTNSKVVIPARARAALSWKSINRLAEENSDFALFLESIERLHQTGDIELIGKQINNRNG